MGSDAVQMIESADVIFWDFDGVIKESVEVKTNAFVKLFYRFGDKITDRVREHHKAHCGMSRLEKIPLYLKWAGVDQSMFDLYCDQFALYVVDDVIKSPWVLGVERYLRFNPNNQTFILISATPQIEMVKILHELDLICTFQMIYGAPTKKKDAIGMSLNYLTVDPENCLMIGDSNEDYLAAQGNKIPFLLRLNSENCKLYESYKGITINDFTIP